MYFSKQCNEKIWCGGGDGGEPSLKNPIDIYPITRIPHQYLYVLVPFNAHTAQNWVPNLLLYICLFSILLLNFIT